MMPMFVPMAVVVIVRVALDIAAARQHENMAAGAQHLDLGAEQS